jgi:hypothetical protein
MRARATDYSAPRSTFSIGTASAPSASTRSPRKRARRRSRSIASEALIERFQTEIIGDEACRGCAVANAAVEIVDEDHPARAVIKKHKLEIAQRLRDLCREMGARQPEVLGDALSLMYSGAFSARLSMDGREKIAALPAAAAALLDSPALGVPRK